MNKLKEHCGAEREIIISRELTKTYEENIGKNLDDVIKYFEGKEVLGEITIVIKGINSLKQNNNYNTLEIKKDLYELISAGLSVLAASKYLAKKNNIKKSIIYNMYSSTD